MGVAVSVAVEGAEEVPVEERADAKFLADIVMDWMSNGPQFLSQLGVPEAVMANLQRIDAGPYADDDEVETSAAEAWQDPRELEVGLEAILAAVVRLQTDDRQASKLRKELARDYLVQVDWLSAYQVVLEDAIKVCDWAAARGKRVALSAW